MFQHPGHSHACPNLLYFLQIFGQSYRMKTPTGPHTVLPLKDIDFSRYSLGERVLLAHELEASLRAEADAAAVPAEYLAELHRRIEQIEAGTAQLHSWDDIKAQLFGPG
jgi:putative addiction module component (TIGR02574 family)